MTTPYDRMTAPYVARMTDTLLSAFSIESMCDEQRAAECGYCIDAPDYIPRGAQRAEFGGFIYRTTMEAA